MSILTYRAVDHSDPALHQGGNLFKNQPVEPWPDSQGVDPLIEQLVFPDLHPKPEPKPEPQS